MGAWGTGIFQDDTACDIRDEYKQLVGDGLSAPEAKAKILGAYKSTFADPDESTVAWLALAAVQWQLGRLDADTLKNALEVIDSRSNLARWNADPKDRKKREGVLEKLRAQILSPQKPESRIRRRVPFECHWKRGELFAYKLLSGKLVIFRVIGHHTDKGGTYPVCEMLDFVGEEILPPEKLQTLPIRSSRADYKHKITKLMLVGLSQKWMKRTQDIDLTLKPEQTSQGGSVVHFKYLDSFLKEWFQLE
jgi:hypothetical protein